jgi:hypothetical protein
MSTFRGKISSDKWIDHSRTAFAVDPRIALSMTMRFPTNPALQSEITQLVQVLFLHIAVIFSDIVLHWAPSIFTFKFCLEISLPFHLNSRHIRMKRNIYLVVHFST